MHPYRIYESGRAKDQWITYLPDETKKNKRRQIKRNGYDRLCEAVIKFYLEQYHIDMRLDELFEDWVLFRRDETSAKAGTIRKDVSFWRTHCRKVKIDRTALGDMKVNEVTPKHLYSFFRKLTSGSQHSTQLRSVTLLRGLLSQGRYQILISPYGLIRRVHAPKDRAYTRRTIANIRGVLNGMFSYAVERDIVSSNPVRDVDLKRMTYKPEMSKSEEVFSFEEAQKLLAVLRTVDDDPYALAIRLDFNLFIRFEEIAGLKWENVDLENRLVYICHQITYEPEMNDDLSFTEKRMVTEGYLKGCTSQGYRTEPLTVEAIEVLKKAKALKPDSEYVFFPSSRPLLNMTFNKRLRKYCEQAGIPYRSSHKIRFYAASTAYNGQNLAQLSKMMGHSQVSTTMHYLRDAGNKDDYTSLFSRLGTQTT